MKYISQIITGNNQCLELNYDFNKYQRNKHTFFKDNNEYNIRYENLQDVLTVFNEQSIECWLQGKTMLGICRDNKLLKNDTDEDIGTKCSWQEVCKNIYPSLIEKGFNVIRATKNNSMLTIMRNHRYIDICFFTNKNNKIGYEKKYFPNHFYDKIISLSINNFNYPVPKHYKNIIKYSYNINL